MSKTASIACYGMEIHPAWTVYVYENTHTHIPRYIGTFESRSLWYAMLQATWALVRDAR